MFCLCTFLILLVTFADHRTGAASTTRDSCTGECTMYYLCKDNKIVTNGAGAIGIRVGVNEPECSNPMHVCCEKRSELDVPSLAASEPSDSKFVLDVPSPGASKPSDSNPVLNVPSPDASKPSDSKPVLDVSSPGASKPSDSEQESCGTRNDHSIGFDATNFPWLVSVFHEEHVPDSFYYACGASLITPHAVLTAGHCVFNKPKEKLLLRAGEWTSQNKELQQYQERRVAEIMTYGEFNDRTFSNNVALLNLTEPFQRTGNVQPICLPPIPASIDNYRCFTVALDEQVSYRDGSLHMNVNMVQIPVVLYDFCRHSSPGPSSYLCANGALGPNRCRTDAGTPLVCPMPGSPNQYYQVGIVSSGVGCGMYSVPSVFGNVASFRYWLEQALYELDPKPKTKGMFRYF
ncbi:phenoloxidase-activating factor 2-like [Anopheles merus]|uniref:phenoloxidase-activating factor 2-like n=1 Tax=Anopheles merus TaxID=30066 RepID=UPI001BE3EEAA|nr:phenoloxidase-activating factor 2-like [Anopheles merus]